MDFNGYLMSGDTVAARIENGTVIPVCSALLPLWLTERNDLEGWLKSRAIDRHRTNSRVLKKLLRLTDSGDLAAVLRAHGATITDHYWIRSDQETELTYPDIRFTSDRFAEVALTGTHAPHVVGVVVNGPLEEVGNALVVTVANDLDTVHVLSPVKVVLVEVGGQVLKRHALALADGAADAAAIGVGLYNLVHGHVSGLRPLVLANG